MCIKGSCNELIHTLDGTSIDMPSTPCLALVWKSNILVDSRLRVHCHSANHQPSVDRCWSRVSITSINRPSPVNAFSTRSQNDQGPDQKPKCTLTNLILIWVDPRIQFVSWFQHQTTQTWLPIKNCGNEEVVFLASAIKEGRSRGRL